MTNKPAPGEGKLRAADWLKAARQYLVQASKDSRPPEEDAAPVFDETGLETQVLLSHILQRPRAWLLAHLDTGLEPEQVAQLNHLLARLADGEPLPYLTGHVEFFGLDFEITPDVLIPRPETELLVEQALHWLAQHPARLRAADVGTGSGCIAISLAHHVPALRVLATDRSPAALRVARRNARRHDVISRMTFAQSDLLSAAAGPFDLVCANLPYIPTSDLPDLQVSRYEPRLALDGGASGLEAIHRLISHASRRMDPGGLILLEMQYDQGKAITTLAQEYLPGASVRVLPDLAGLPRLVRIEITTDSERSSIR